MCSYLRDYNPLPLCQLFCRPTENWKYVKCNLSASNVYADQSGSVLATKMCPLALASEPPPRAFLVEESDILDLLYLVRSSRET